MVVFSFYVLSFVAMVITGLLFQRVLPSREAFVLELPPYRNPCLGTILRRGWTQMLNVAVTTRTFIVVGAAAIWLLTNLPPGTVQGSGATIADGIGRLFQPLLGAMAVIYKTSEAGPAAGVEESPLRAAVAGLVAAAGLAAGPGGVPGRSADRRARPGSTLLRGMRQTPSFTN
ncbi:MAG: hypothetical protein VKN13_02180 [Cyanobacteriota bacterium]|nr:hypothetical protein [Cyanobacteriota bacterium]